MAGINGNEALILTVLKMRIRMGEAGYCAERPGSRVDLKSRLSDRVVDPQTCLKIFEEAVCSLFICLASVLADFCINWQLPPVGIQHRRKKLAQPTLVYYWLHIMATSVRSFAKINLGLKIGPLCEDGFHELRTIYQTVALNDQVRVDVSKGVGIEITCKDPRVPDDESNTCWRVADRILR